MNIIKENLIFKDGKAIRTTIETMDRNCFSHVHVRELKISLRAQNALERNNISSLKELIKTKKERLVNLPNLGKKTIKEIEDFLYENLKVTLK